MDASIAAAFAAATPAYVRATSIAWQVVSSADGAVIAERTGLREALDLAAERIAEKRDPQGSPVRVMRDDDGAPIGVWRYLPASAAEDEPNPQDGVRLTERSIWQMASGLNARPQPIGIDGGPGSVVHGLAHDSSTPINGAAHRGLVVYDYEDRAGLYLQSEIVPDVARLIDRGQLAWGSCHFWTSEPLDDTGAPDDAGLISYGLTNTPADSRIVPANAARAFANLTHARFATRTRQLLRAAPLALERSMEGTFTKEQLQAALDAITSKEITIEQLCKVAEGQSAQEAPPDAVPDAGPEMEMAQPPAEQRAEAEKRAVPGLEDPAALETFATTVIDELRTILGKPDADPASLLSELQAMRDKLAAAANAAPPAQDGTPADQQGANAMSAEGRAKRTAAVTRANAVLGRKDGDDVDDLLASLAERIERHGHEAWADGEIAARKLVVNADAREALVDIAANLGRERASKFLAGLSAPPSGQLMRQSLNGNQGAAPTTLSQAVDACVADAKAILDDEAKKANRASLSADPSLTRARAQHIARERYPHFFTTNDAA